MGCPMLGRYRWRLVLVEVIEGRLVRQGEVFADQERRVAPLLRLPHIVHPGGTRKSPYSTAYSIDRGHRFHADGGQRSTGSRTVAKGGRSDESDRTRRGRDQPGRGSVIGADRGWNRVVHAARQRRVGNPAEGVFSLVMSCGAALSTAAASLATNAAAVGKAVARAAGGGPA